MTYEFKDANGWHILFSDFDFECAEHVTLEVRERDSDTMYATYRKTDMVPHTSIVTGV